MIALRQVPGNIVVALAYFVLGETGFVRREPASTAAWIVGLLVVGAVLLGAPDRAEAACPVGWGPTCTPPGTTDCHYCLEEGCSSFQCAPYGPGVQRCYCYP